MRIWWLSSSHDTQDLTCDRNIFYQNVDLFKSQGVVDDLVDNLAYTLDLGREDLNIVCTFSG